MLRETPSSRAEIKLSNECTVVLAE